MKKIEIKDVYPLTIIMDRYTGCYSGGRYTAWNWDACNIPDGVDSNDSDCDQFWREFKQGQPIGFCGDRVFVGIGQTIQDAVDDLLKKMNS